MSGAVLDVADVMLGEELTRPQLKLNRDHIQACLPLRQRCSWSRTSCGWVEIRMELVWLKRRAFGYSASVIIEFLQVTVSFTKKKWNPSNFMREFTDAEEMNRKTNEIEKARTKRWTTESEHLMQKKNWRKLSNTHPSRNYKRKGLNE